MENAQNIREAAKLIENFVDGTCRPYDWDDFLNGSRMDAELQGIREECERVEIDFPARAENEWCNAEGGLALLAIAARLRNDAAQAESIDPEHQKSKPNNKGCSEG